MILARDHRRASEVLVQLVDLLDDMGSRRWLADALEMGALVLEVRGDLSVAIEMFEASTALRGAAGEQVGGTRALSAEIRQAHERLLASSDHCFATSNSPEAAGRALLNRLRADPGNDTPTDPNTAHRSRSD